MPGLTSALLAAWMMASVAVTQAEEDTSAVTIIHAGHLIAVPGERVREGASVVIRDGRIETIENGYVTRDGAEIVDLTGHWVLPGLIDAHVHLLSERGANSRLDTFTLSSADRAFVGARHARRTLEAGFTTVQDVGGDLEAILALRDAIRNGDAVGPRMRVAGPSITPTGGHGDVNGYNQRVIENFSSPGACNGPADCARAVRALVQAGVDTIKITATGGVLSNTAAGLEVQFMDDELRAIVQRHRPRAWCDRCECFPGGRRSFHRARHLPERRIHPPFPQRRRFSGPNGHGGRVRHAGSRGERGVDDTLPAGQGPAGRPANG